VFWHGWFYNGDIGSVSPDGLLTITGCSGDFINSGGNKVAARVIEDVLMAMPEVTEAAAFGAPDRLGVGQIWAAIVAGVRVENAARNAVCHAHLGDKAPKFILQIKGLPRNANGKVMREELIRFAATQQR
jgi:acyl-CoA synthetase (AMP-forming)/AMP-acid ligase II